MSVLALCQLNLSLKLGQVGPQVIVQCAAEVELFGASRSTLHPCIKGSELLQTMHGYTLSSVSASAKSILRHWKTERTQCPPLSCETCCPAAIAS